MFCLAYETIFKQKFPALKWLYPSDQHRGREQIFTDINDQSNLNRNNITYALPT